MSGEGAHAAASQGHSAPNTLSVPWVVLASVLMGLGVLMIALWLVTFDYLLFSGTVVLFVGFLMIFSPRMGSDHA